MNPFMTNEEHVSPGWTLAERKTVFLPGKRKGRLLAGSSGNILLQGRHVSLLGTVGACVENSVVDPDPLGSEIICRIRIRNY